MRSRLVAAFAAVYILWGSTYLAIRFAVETLPPMLMIGARYVIAGGLLFAWARWRDGDRATAEDWRTSALSGTLMLAGGNGAVVWAAQRVPSGIVALLVAVVPIWMVLLDWVLPAGRRPRASVFAGLAMGLAGLLLLIGPSSMHGKMGIDPASVVVLLAGSLAWAVGSLLTQRAPRPTSGRVGSSIQMLAGGSVATLVAVFRGEPAQLDLANASALSLGALAYLIVFGSLIGFTAYIYMLAHTTAAKAATYAYVNPVVAVFLGWAFANEPVTPRTVIAAAIILGGVAIITLAREEPSGAPEASRAAA